MNLQNGKERKLKEDDWNAMATQHAFSLTLARQNSQGKHPQIWSCDLCHIVLVSFLFKLAKKKKKMSNLRLLGKR